jgi:hypothetical protein
MRQHFQCAVANGQRYRDKPSKPSGPAWTVTQGRALVCMPHTLLSKTIGLDNKHASLVQTLNVPDQLQPFEPSRAIRRLRNPGPAHVWVL